jgi:hypothetical protein
MKVLITAMFIANGHAFQRNEQYEATGPFQEVVEGCGCGGEPVASVQTYFILRHTINGIENTYKALSNFVMVIPDEGLSDPGLYEGPGSMEERLVQYARDAMPPAPDTYDPAGQIARMNQRTVIDLRRNRT